MKKLFIIVIICSLGFGCADITVFQEYRKLDNLVWGRFDIHNFEVPVKKGEPLDLYFALRHHTDFPFNFIDVNITLFTPDGEMRSRDYHYRLIGTDLKWKGDGMGALWDIDLPIRKNIVFNKSGICKIRVESKMNRTQLPGIIELGVKAKKSEK